MSAVRLGLDLPTAISHNATTGTSTTKPFEDIAGAFNEMLTDLKQTIVNIQKLAEDIERTSADAIERVGAIERASDDVSHSIEEIAPRRRSKTNGISRPTMR